jgi:hypothetical protein
MLQKVSVCYLVKFSHVVPNAISQMMAKIEAYQAAEDAQLLTIEEKILRLEESVATLCYESV